MADINWSLTLPQPARFTLRLRSPSLRFASPLSGQVQTVSLPGSTVWGALLEFSSMRASASAPLEALLAQLRGQANRLLLWHLARPGLTGVGGGSPVVNGAGQTGSTLQVTNLPPSTVGWALPGDMLGIGGELKMLTARVDTNSGGQAVISFEPPIRTSPGNGTAIVISQPTARFVPVDEVREWSHEPGRVVTGHALELVEAFV